jgi:CubicO group peptidase (beta-lactamase class C family)
VVWLRRFAWLIGSLVLLVVIWLGASAIVYSPEYVFRTLRSGESSYEDYVGTFPRSPLTASQSPYQFEEAPDEAGVSSAFETALGVDDLDQFLTETDTQALIVVTDGNLVFEGYYNGFDRESMLTSFSVAKSFDSTLIGIAIGEGFIGAVTDPITDYLPELAERDPGFAEITIQDVLRMASGLDYQELRWFLFNGDDPLTTYYPDQREITLENTTIVDPPGLYFNYNKYHPQLLGMILERTTGMSVTEYTQTRLWDPLGMQFDGAWNLDSEESGFEKMETGVNARALDYAKLGQLFLQGGVWEGDQVVPASWVEESTSLDPSTQNAKYYSHSFGPSVYDDGAGYYKYMWYGRLRDGAASDFFAEGDHGQSIYVSPANGVVIVRNGTEYGIGAFEWIDAFYDTAGRL